MTVCLAERSPEERLRSTLRELPYWQRYEITQHDPPTPEGYVLTLQLVGPPAMEPDGTFIGWGELRRLRRESPV